MKHASFQSLAQAVEAYYGDIRRFIQQRTGCADMAEDVVQETWLRASATAAGFPDNPRAYLYRMAGNLAVDRLRREQHRSGLEHPETGSPDHDLLENIACPGPDPLGVLVTESEFDALNAAVRDLPDTCRKVFLLYRGQGLRMREVAARLGISEKTVEKHIARAMIDCRKRLRQAGREI